MHKVALFAIVFASLAPSISHALSKQQNFSSFSQEICSSDGQKITIQVVTTKGQQLTAELAAKNNGNPSSNTLNHHLEHCPFCVNPIGDVATQLPYAPIITVLEAQEQHISAISQAGLPSFSVLLPPSQAPPTL